MLLRRFNYLESQLLTQFLLVIGVSKTTLNIDDMLGFIELGRVVLLGVTVYYTKICRLKSTMKNIHRVESRRSQTPASSCPLSVKSRREKLILPVWCMTRHLKSYQSNSSSIQGFIRAQLQTHREPTWLILAKSPASLEVKLIQRSLGPQARKTGIHHNIHIVSINNLACRARYTTTLLSGWLFQGLCG